MASNKAPMSRPIDINAPLFGQSAISPGYREPSAYSETSSRAATTLSDKIANKMDWQPPDEVLRAPDAQKEKEDASAQNKLKASQEALQVSKKDAAARRRGQKSLSKLKQSQLKQSIEALTGQAPAQLRPDDFPQTFNDTGMVNADGDFSVLPKRDEGYGIPPHPRWRKFAGV